MGHGFETKMSNQTLALNPNRRRDKSNLEFNNKISHRDIVTERVTIPRESVETVEKRLGLSSKAEGAANLMCMLFQILVHFQFYRYPLP